MVNTKERIKKRRLYLLKKGGAYTDASLQVAFGVLAAILTVGVLLLTIHSLLSLDVLTTLFFAAWTVVFGAITRDAFLSAPEMHLKAKRLPYVPPVTADTLPAETGEQELLRSTFQNDRSKGSVGNDGYASSQDITDFHWVKQQGKHDCGVAALAMILGYPYERVRSYFPGVDQVGLRFGECAWYLRLYGCRVSAPQERLSLRRDVGSWPPAPYAPLHLCSVSVRPRSSTRHWIVMLANGSVLDPLTPSPKQLSDYATVHSIIGIYPNGDHSICNNTANGHNKDCHEANA